MIPKRVLLENFLSFGEPAVEIGFTDNEPLWVICGPNGVGKSAIFDAVTYALFASHRGGVKNAEQLIRHGANSFRIEFDFELNGRDFRIARTKATRTTQRVYSRVAGTDEWTPEPIGNTAPDVKRWVEKNIGLEFEAFKASVLLRQGEADAILTATGTERLALLKTIIGVDRFEYISDRIHDDLKEHKDELDRLRLTLDNAPLVSDEDLNAARAALAEAEQRRKAAHERNARAGELLAGAKRWNMLVARKSDLEEAIGEARKRAEQADRIRSDRARLETLTMVVPKLRTIVELRERIRQRDSEFAKLHRQESECGSERSAILKALESIATAKEAHRAEAERHDQAIEQLREEIARDTKSLMVAEELSSLQADLAVFPADLSQKLCAAEAELLSATEIAKRAGEIKAATAELLKQAEAKQSEFATVGIGVKCSLCGQVVDKTHAEKEKASLAHQVDEFQKKLQAELKAAQDAASNRDACEVKCGQISRQNQQRLLLIGKLQTMQKLGISSDAPEIRRRLEEKEQTIIDHEWHRDDERKQQKTAAAEYERLDKERQQVERLLTELTARIRSLETTHAADLSHRNTLAEQLPTNWQECSIDFDLNKTDELENERNRFVSLGVAEMFDKLQQDGARLQEWIKQFAETTAEQDEIPVDARVPVEEVETQNQKAAAEIAAAESARDDAKTRMDDLDRCVANQRELAAVVRTAERRHDLQKKLDELLGKKGLQRELVRAAEHDIVAYAKDTLDKLSDGDLTLELAEEQDVDSAFDLRVLRAEDPAPIGVSFLSGSQKFRVAVSVALAIGRFASGQARPLESVIIDEGFGSLDREGLRAMADELNRLRAYLRRIVLVSHQEEFADRFPVGIRLFATDNGTVAEPFRR